MNKKIVLTLAVASALTAAYAAKKDPAVMRVAGRDVPRSEFEYLYHKNAGQQLQPQTIDEYAEMFKIYKLKVADALAAGIDTTAAFNKELHGYLAELSLPYSVDSTYVYSLMHEAYDRMGQEVQANHIMLSKPRGVAAPKDVKGLADSLLNVLKNGGDFAELARQYSEDRGSAQRGGDMGWITALMVPYDFETAAYALKPGELSEVVESPVGYHILLGGEKRPARGEVLAEHILLLTDKNASPAQQAMIQARIDSIYNVAIAPGADFEALAVQYSDDKGSARQGGKLPWFGVGRMVQEFDSAAFATPVGQISKPFRTGYGWHIVKKLDARPLGSYAEVEPTIKQAFTNRQDQRTQYITRQFTDKLKKQYKFKYNEPLRAKVIESATRLGVSPEFTAELAAMDSTLTLFSFAGEKVPLGDFVKNQRMYRNIGFPSSGASDIKSRMDSYESQKLYAHYIKELPNTNADFRNLQNEYRDGMLLFEISNRRVWDKAVQDTAGLQRYFEQNRADYAWQAPRVKGLFIQAANDSVAGAVRARLAALTPEQAVDSIRAEFPKLAKIDRILAAQGDNAMVDALVFGGETVPNPDSKYPVYFIENMRMLTAPEEVADVRGAVTSDYQNALEKEWIAELEQKYPVEIFPGELKKIK